jgi:hypothetical protein
MRTDSRSAATGAKRVPPWWRWAVGTGTVRNLATLSVTLILLEATLQAVTRCSQETSLVQAVTNCTRYELTDEEFLWRKEFLKHYDRAIEKNKEEPFWSSHYKPHADFGLDS